MDPLTLLLTALTAGLAASVKDTASEAVKDAYTGLKTLIQRKFEGKPKAQAALVAYEEDPETYEKPLKKALIEEHLDQDQDLLETASKLMGLLQAQQAGRGLNIVQNTGTVQGQIVENTGTVTMNFGEPPRT
jgi:hypothetical protein